jgi:16S rRNA C1402 (ribose-2'-O) methylase RsmI
MLKTQYTLTALKKLLKKKGLVFEDNEIKTEESDPVQEINDIQALMEEIRENGEIIILVPQTYINIDQKSFDDDDHDSLG